MSQNEQYSYEAQLLSQRVCAAELSAGTSGHSIYQAVLKQAQAIGASGNLLDYGAGTGYFSRLICDLPQFTHVTATDLFSYEAHFEHPKLDWIFCDLNQGIPGHDGEYDLIVALEIIEHLENPRFVAREWFRLLKPGGSLIFSTPNNESLRSLVSFLGKRHFSAFTGASYPAHITALLRMDMERILMEAGFDQIGFSFSDFGAIPKATKVTWQKVSAGMLKGLRFSDNIVCSARKNS